MIDSFKKEKKDIMEKCERQRKELNELENKNMELARELNNLREF
jgi:cell division protein FtsB